MAATLVLTKDDNFDYYLEKAKTYKTEWNRFERALARKASTLASDVSAITFSDWEDDVSTKMQSFVSNSLSKSSSALDPLINNSGVVIGTNMTNLVSKLEECKEAKDWRTYWADEYDKAPETIPNPNYDPDASVSYYGGGFMKTLKYIHNDKRDTYEKNMKSYDKQLDTLVPEANALIAAIAGATFDPESTFSGGNGEGGNSNSGGNSNGKDGGKDSGKDSGKDGGDKGNNNGDAPDDDPNSPFRKGGLNDMTEQDAYPSGNLRNGNTYDIQYTDTDGNVHDATLTFSFGNTRDPKDTSGWNITVKNPDGSTSKVYPYQIAQDENGYKIDVYKDSSNNSGNSQPKTTGTQTQAQSSSSAGKPGSTPKTREDSSNLSSSNPRSQNYNPDGVELTSSNPRSHNYKPSGQQADTGDTSNTTTKTSKPVDTTGEQSDARDTHTSKPVDTATDTAKPEVKSTPTSTNTANNAAKREQVASEMGIRDQVSLMDNVHTSNVRFSHNDDEIYLQQDPYTLDYGFFRNDGSRVDGYSFSHDQVTQAQYDENNWATYPEVEDAVVDYFVSLE